MFSIFERKEKLFKYMIQRAIIKVFIIRPSDNQTIRRYSDVFDNRHSLIHIIETIVKQVETNH